MTVAEPVADDDLARCVSCGLCLPHCPTFRVTGEEGRSPRGRIALIKTVQEAGGLYDRDSADMLNTCIQCRGCEPACPSGVPYGRIISGARHALVEQGLSTRRRWSVPILRVGLWMLTRPALLSGMGRTVAAAQWITPRRWRLGPLPVRLGRRLQQGPANPDVWLLTGCVMDVWMRETHRNTAALVSATGRRLGVSKGQCCGALHHHAGASDAALTLARQTMAAMPGDARILVNSAGCGAAMKEYGDLLGTDDARAFSKRVMDVHEWLDAHLDEIVADQVPNPVPVLLQDPCHLRHVQRTHGAVQRVLSRVASVSIIDDDGLCCGAGGAFSLLQPRLAGAVRDRKVAAIREARADPTCIVASANPGCSMFLSAAGLTVRHPVDIVAEALELES
ncbi:MAG: (Fe-S)-binding protein [Ilumatobacteraceae bacterium]